LQGRGFHDTAEEAEPLATGDPDVTALSPRLPILPLPGAPPAEHRLDPALAARFLGILPAAGGGSRLQPLPTPKELLPILYAETADGTGLRPIAAAEFALASLYLASVRHCFVVVSDAKPEIAHHLGSGADRDMALGYLLQPTPLGLADAVDTAYPWIGDRCTCLALPDTVFSPLDALDQVCRDLLEHGADVVLGVFPVANPCQLGPVRIDAAGNVLEVLEKPPATDLANSWGVAAWSPVFTRFLHERLAAEGPSAHPSIGTLFHAALGAGLRVRAVAFADGAYLDAGTPEGLKQLVAGARLVTVGRDRGAGPDGGAVEDGLGLLRAATAMQRNDPEAALAIATHDPLPVPPLEAVRAFGEPAALSGALVALGGLLADRGDRGRSAAIFRGAADIAPANALAHRRVGQLALDEGRLDEALARAWQAVDLAPQDPDGFTLLGQALAASGHLEDARQAFADALRHDPEHAPAHRGLADLLLSAGDVERAEDHLQRAILHGHTHLETLLRFGWLLHDTSRFERAEAIARLAVRVAPHAGRAHHLLGWLLMRSGRRTAARPVLARAVELAPDLVIAQRLLAEVEVLLGNQAAAEKRLRAVLRQTPDDPDLLSSLAWVLLDRRKLGGAERAARRALTLAPTRTDIQIQLAWALLERGRLDAAIAVSVAILSAKPDNAEAHRVIGEIHFRRRELDAADDWLQRALACDPHNAPTLGRLGALQMILHRMADAERSLRAAIEADPRYPGAYHDLAFLLERQGRFAEAERVLRAVLDMRPLDAIAWYGLGRLLDNLERNDEAVDALHRAVEIDDAMKDAWIRLARLDARGSLAARRRLARLAPETMHDHLADLIDRATGWLSFEEYQRIVDHALVLFPDDDLFEAARQFSLVYDVEQTAESLRAEADAFGRRATPCAAAPRRTARRPRIAYVGNHLHRELMNDYIGFHDHDRFEISLFGNDDLDKVSQRDPRLRTYRLDEVDLAAACAAMEIDLVVDVVGPYPRSSLLEPFLALRQRVAPVQCLWMNTFTTTGSPAYDFVITDGCLVRPGEEHWFSERVLRLPSCQWFWTEPDRWPEPGPPPALSNGYVTLGSANRGLKLNDAVLDLWADVMARLPSARLRLVGWHTDGWRLRRRILARFADRGVTQERIEFLHAFEHARLPEYYQGIDLTLDTFPFNGGLTTFESLWMGVPVVALAGQRFTARQTEDILGVLGLDRWVAPDRPGFVGLVADLAADLDQLATARGQLRGRMRASPLCDGPQFARDLEALFLEMLARR
jgi:predicted O-linked N-acetylglucosamine transferase (SPINDLY family)/dTDP-glucose pyrophosphorylase/predicted negative regulator of RcsB-dependent stress response